MISMNDPVHVDRMDIRFIQQQDVILFEDELLRVNCYTENLDGYWLELANDFDETIEAFIPHDSLIDVYMFD